MPSPYLTYGLFVGSASSFFVPDFILSQERQRYLQRLLKTHADIRFSDVDISEYKPIVPNRKTRFD